jgi:hypothetical protein
LRVFPQSKNGEDVVYFRAGAADVFLGINKDLCAPVMGISSNILSENININQHQKERVFMRINIKYLSLYGLHRSDELFC